MNTQRVREGIFDIEIAKQDNSYKIKIGNVSERSTIILIIKNRE